MEDAGIESSSDSSSADEANEDSEGALNQGMMNQIPIEEWNEVEEEDENDIASKAAAFTADEIMDNMGALAVLLYVRIKKLDIVDNVSESM